MATNSPVPIFALTSFTATNGPVGVGNTLHRPVSSSGTFIGFPRTVKVVASRCRSSRLRVACEISVDGRCRDGRGSVQGAIGGRCARARSRRSRVTRIDSVNVLTTCARARVASSSCASCATLRGRGSSTAIGVPSVAGGPATIGTMRSDSSRASSTLLVIITVVDRLGAVADPSCARSCCSVSRVSASSAPNGSSRNRICGRVASARARATRCRMPPESWRGRRCSALPRPTRSSVARARARCSSRGRVGKGRVHGQSDVLERREPRQQRVVLKDERGVAADPALRLAADGDGAARRDGSDRPAR